MNRVYCCIDLKSFFASVECVARNLDPFKANLVVADPDRQNGTVCLAVSPMLKSLGVKNRCRVFEIPKNINYVMARPRMRAYMNKSTEIYSIYLKYISPEDIHVYSIDECFIDLTDYQKLYGKTPLELAKMLIGEVYNKTGIRATVGIGTNLFLTKVALDITAKHSPDFIGYLDEDLFKKTIWHYRPITDIWNIGKGIAKHLERLAIFDLYGVSHCSEDLLYNEFGMNAELLIDHANGVEPCTIEDIHAYRSKAHSLSNGQILFSDYIYTDALKVLKEMVDGLVLEMVEKGLVAGGIFLSIGYSDKSLPLTGGSFKLPMHTNSYKKIVKYFIDYFNQTVDKTKLIRKINIGLTDVIFEDVEVYDIFSNVEEERKESSLAKTVIKIKHKYGKNSLLKGTSFEDKATAKERNQMIGGHKSGE